MAQGNKSRPTLSHIQEVFEKKRQTKRALLLCEQAEQAKTKDAAALHLVWARILQWANQPGAAISKARVALKSAHTAEERVQACLIEGTALCDLARSKSAQEVLIQAWDSAKKLSGRSRRWGPEVLMAMGQAQSAAGKQEEALETCQKALEASEDFGRKDLVAGIRARKSLCHFRKGRLAEARQEAEAGIRDGVVETLGLAECFRALAVVQSISYRMFEGLKHHRQALDLFLKLDYASGIVREYISLGLSYLTMSDLELAEHFFRKAVLLGEDGDNLVLAGTAYSRLGTLSLSQGDFEEALRYYEKDRELSRGIENPANLGYIHRNVGRCLAQLGRSEEALAEYTRAVEKFKEVGDAVNAYLTGLDLRLAACIAESRAGRGRRARAVGKRIDCGSLPQLDEKYLDERPPLAARRMFVEACERGDEAATEPEGLLGRALDIMQRHANHAQMAEMLHIYGKLAAERGKPEQAAALLRQGLGIADIYALHGMKKRIMGLLGSLDDREIVDFSLERESSRSAGTSPPVEGTVLAPLENVIGSSRVFVGVLDKARRVAATDSTVLLVGESGTGKELVARLIHQWSRRGKQKFIAVNCGAIPKDLVESTLFGHLKGAFTGATADKKGSIEAAEGGTIFLDEVSELPPMSQVKLLRFLENREIQRVGDPEGRKVDVRVLAATNRDLDEAVASGLLREDLYYRLAVVPLVVPPLRDRGEDVIQIARHFLASMPIAQEKGVRALTRAAEDCLRHYPWPGNVRELFNVMTRAVIFSDSQKLTIEDIEGPEKMLADKARDIETLDAVVEKQIKAALKRCRGNQTLAAKILGIHRNTLMKRLRKIQEPET